MNSPSKHGYFHFLTASAGITLRRGLRPLAPSAIMDRFPITTGEIK
jgi:hypothetical protein